MRLNRAGRWRYRFWPPRHLRLWAATSIVAFFLMVGADRFYRAERDNPDPSLVVWPFASDDKEQGYLATGISEDLTKELARIPALFVVSSKAASAYKDTGTSLGRAAQELRVRYVLNGSVRRMRDRIRINAQLMDSETRRSLWAGRYDGTWDDVLKLQDRVVSEVATALALRLTPQLEQPSNASAYDAVLRGLEMESRGAPDDLSAAVREFRRAIAIDPSYGRASAELAWVYYTSVGNEARQRALGIGTLEAIALAQETFSEAMKFPSARAYQLAGERHINHWEADQAIDRLEHALKLDPSDVWNYRQMAKAKILGGQAAEGLKFIENSLRVDPREFQWTTSLRGLAEFSLERYEDAAASLEETLAGPAPNRYDNLLPLMAAYGKLGALDKARALRKELDAYTAAYGDGKITALLAAHHVPFARLEDALRFQDGLVKAGIPELPFEFEPGSKDRLSEEEIRSLLYGHTVSGRVERSIDPDVRMVIDFQVGVAWSVTTSFDGASVRYIWGDVHNGGGRIHNDGRRQCFYFSYEKACIAVFRNPRGSRERQDEYYALFPWYLISFSPER